MAGGRRGAAAAAAAAGLLLLVERRPSLEFCCLGGALRLTCAEIQLPPAHLRLPRAGCALAAAATRRCAIPEEGDSAAESDWRDFRARLVERERAEGAGPLTPGSSKEVENVSEGWAYSTPLVEKGSLLLSRPGGRFAARQQYFHKAVIFVVQHQATGDVGLILNRPTSLTSAQLGLPGPPWAVWFGGDCQGITSLRDRGRGGVAAFCLHTVEEYAASSREVIRGVYLADFADAFALVQSGQARPDDFMLLLGYCGWGEGQLQRELSRGDVWTLASVDRRLVVRELRQAPGQPEAASAGELQADAALPGDGVAAWRRLYAALGAECREQLDSAGVDDQFADAMLRQWVEANLKRSAGQ